MTNYYQPNSPLLLRDKRDALASAKEKLNEEDKALIDAHANDLFYAMKAKNPTTQFTMECAYEILAELGMFMNRSTNGNTQS